MNIIKSICEGKTITRVEFAKGESGDPRILIYLSSGAILWVASDPEGNGDGFLHVEREPDEIVPPLTPQFGRPYVQFDPAWVGKSFRDSKGRIFKVAGYNNRAPKKPVMLTGLDGRNYKCAVAMIASGVLKPVEA